MQHNRKAILAHTPQEVKASLNALYASEDKYKYLVKHHDMFATSGSLTITPVSIPPLNLQTTTFTTTGGTPLTISNSNSNPFIFQNPITFGNFDIAFTITADNTQVLNTQIIFGVSDQIGTLGGPNPTSTLGNYVGLGLQVTGASAPTVIANINGTITNLGTAFLPNLVFGMKQTTLGSWSYTIWDSVNFTTAVYTTYTNTLAGSARTSFIEFITPTTTPYTSGRNFTITLLPSMTFPALVQVPLALPSLPVSNGPIATYKSYVGNAPNGNWAFDNNSGTGKPFFFLNPPGLLTIPYSISFTFPSNAQAQVQNIAMSVGICDGSTVVNPIASYNGNTSGQPTGVGNFCTFGFNWNSSSLTLALNGSANGGGALNLSTAVFTFRELVQGFLLYNVYDGAVFNSHTFLTYSFGTLTGTSRATFVEFFTGGNLPYSNNLAPYPLTTTSYSTYT